ncbi:hypothetical protein OC835_008005, partial [Tilletia horrida]
MSSNPRVNAPLVADKSELSRAGIKVSAPEKWKGDRSLQLFTDWVHSVAHYFKVHAPLTETLKVNLLGGYLHGDPLDWYWRHVAPNADQWSAADVVISLRRQFLIDELSRQAADKFEKAEQGSRDVHAFQAYLLKLADQMAEYPSPVALNRRLLNGMKPSVSSAIIANRGIDAELSPWADIVQAAMDQERAMRHAGALNKAPASLPRDDRNNSRVRNNRPPPPSKPVLPRAAAPAPSKPTTGLYRPPPPSTPRNSQAPGTRPSGPKPSDQCRACQAFGHWASECPSRLRANVIDVEPEDTGEHGDHCDDEDEPGLIFFDDEEDEELMEVDQEDILEPEE